MNDNHIENKPGTHFDPIESNQTLPVFDYLQILWFRRKLIFVITLFVAIVAYIQVSEIKNVYTAKSTLMIGLPEAQVVDIEQVLRPFNDADSEMEVLRSNVLAVKVINRLNLLNESEFNPSLRLPEKSAFDFLQHLNPMTWIPQSWKKAVAETVGRETEHAPPPAPTSDQEREEQKQKALMSTAVGIFLGKLSLDQKGYGDVINITFNSYDPKMAARLANELAESYIVDQLESKFEATEKANAWLTEQLADMEAKVVESERAVELYREEHGLVENAEENILDRQLSELNSQLIIARAEWAEVNARVAQLRRLLQSGGQSVETAAEVQSSVLIQQLRSQEAEALGRLSELSIEYGSKHPRMLQVQAELVDIRARIRNEVERIADGLEHEAEFASTKVASIEASLRLAKGETNAQNKEAIQLRALQREAAANRTLYETFLNRFKETSSTEGLETSDARVLSEADPPGAPSYPNRGTMMRNYVLMGFIAACALVLGLQLLSPGMTTPEQVQKVLGAYVLGLIPKIPGKTPLHDYILTKPNSASVEAINSLRFSLALSDPDHPVRAIAVTSSVPEEGKSTLAISLARIVASSGQKVLLVDGDLRRSSLGKRLGLEGAHKGLSDLVIAGDVDLSEFLLKDKNSNVDYLPPGTAKFANATDIFASHRMQSIIELFKSRFDMVIIDTPPVMAVADARIIGRVVDKTVFVVRWDKTPRKVARAAVEQLRRAGVDLAGIVVQQVDLKRYSRVGYGDSGWYYHYGRYGGYSSG